MDGWPCACWGELWPDREAVRCLPAAGGADNFWHVALARNELVGKALMDGDGHYIQPIVQVRPPDLVLSAAGESEGYEVAA